VLKLLYAASPVIAVDTFVVLKHLSHAHTPLVCDALTLAHTTPALFCAAAGWLLQIKDEFALSSDEEEDE
jgi:hypothetical protein